MENIGYLVTRINKTARELQGVASPAYKPDYALMHHQSMQIARMAFDLTKLIEEEAKKHG